jgi:hypothetical protein
MKAGSVLRSAHNWTFAGFYIKAMIPALKNHACAIQPVIHTFHTQAAFTAAFLF